MKLHRKSALIAGIALLIMAIAAAFTYGYIHNLLFVTENGRAIVENLTTNRMLFSIEIFGWTTILILDVIVAWALYVFFRDENKKLSMLMGSLRIVFVFIFGVAIFNLISVLKIISGDVDEVQIVGEQIMKSVESFETTWSFSLIIFGFHLFLLGMLAFKSKNIHNVWGILLVFAAVSYILIHSANFLFPEFESQITTAEAVLSIPMAFGEVGFAFWLIIRGGKPKIISS